MKKGFWGITTAICVTVLVYHLTMSCIQYFRYETDVSVSLVTHRQLTFPAVTICNLNPMKKSAVSESSALSRLISDDNRKRKKRDNSALGRHIDEAKFTRQKRSSHKSTVYECVGLCKWTHVLIRSCVCIRVSTCVYVYVCKRSGSVDIVSDFI